MYKRIDIEEDIEGYSFANKEGEIELVKMDVPGIILVEDCDGNRSYFYQQDIPKLIKALEAAYNHKD